MMTITLYCGRLTLVSDIDYPRLSLKRWRVSEHNASRKPYVVASAGGGTIYMHREITKCPTQYEVDHWDHDTLNNQRGNLRIATYAQNTANRRGWSLSGFKGVYREGMSKCRARIMILGEQKHLGTFDSAEDAARAYDKASYEQFGEFAYLNFPDDYPRTIDHPKIEIPFFGEDHGQFQHAP